MKINNFILFFLTKIYMSTINFNLKNKDESQIKNEILSKMSKIRQNYDNDNAIMNYFTMLLLIQIKKII